MKSLIERTTCCWLAVVDIVTCTYIYTVVLISCLLLTCPQANDQCQSSLSMSMVQHARTLFAYHDVAWRNWDETRSVDTQLNCCRCMS